MHWIDPDSLPATKGVVTSFVLNDHGDLDGAVLTLKGGAPQLVHFPPHMGALVVKVFRIGAHMEVRGVKPRNADMIAAVALRAENGKEVVDLGHEE